MFLLVTKTQLKSVTNTYFSNIPYSAYKSNLMCTEGVGKLKQRLGAFKWRSNVVSLRAPKHFKVGRQHYNKTRRTIHLTFNNTGNTWSKLKTNNVSVACFVAMSTPHIHVPVQPALTVNKTTTITFKLGVYLSSVK